VWGGQPLPQSARMQFVLHTWCDPKVPEI
jgi:hypothetical protein